MGRQHSLTTISILNLMRERGSLNYLEIEREVLGTQGQGLHRIHKLREQGYIQPLPKERGQLKRYGLTRQGAEVIGLHLQELARLARPSVMDLPRYTPPAFVCARAGAMQAFSLPSRGGST